MTDAARLSERRLLWPDCGNVRDLGGLATADGLATVDGCGPGRPGVTGVRRGAIVRADLLTHLTPAGWQALVDHGVRTVIDLRSPGEIDRHPYALGEAAVAAGVAHTALSMLPLDADMMERLSHSSSRGEEYVIFAEVYAGPITAVLRAILAARPGGVLYHCHAGKDRTGIITALLLGNAGVPEGVIVADYAESQRLLWPLWEQEAAAALAAGEPEPVRPLAEPETMIALLDHLRVRYGGIPGYLEAIGLTAGEREALAERLLS